MTQPQITPLLSGLSQPELLFGKVLAATPNGYIIQQHQAGTVIALKAFSCPFVPLCNDQVSFLRSADGQYYIIAILQRTAEVSAEMQVPHGLHINTPENIDLNSAAMNIVNNQTRITTADTALNSSRVAVQAKHASLQAEHAETTAGTLIQRIRDSLKIIERIEQVRAHDVIHNIRNLFLQRTRQTDISAEKDIKINGERIHMG